MDPLLINLIWVATGALFGIYMYKRGMVAGAEVGVKAAILYLSMLGKHEEAEGLTRFIKDISEKGFTLVSKPPKDEDD